MMQFSNNRIYMAGSRYSVLSSAALEWSKKRGDGGRSLLVIFLENKEVSSIEKLIDLYKYFDEVCYVKSPMKSGRIFLFRCLLSSGFILKRLNVSEEFLRSILSRNCEYFSQNYIYAVMFRKFISSFYFIDEGLSSYSGRVLDNRYRNSLLKIANVITLGSLMRPISGIFLYQPELYFGLPIKVGRIPSDAVLEVVGKISEVDIEGEVGSSNDRGLPLVLYLGTPIRGLSSLVESGELTLGNYKYAQKVEDSVVRYSARGFPKFRYRKHPNQTVDEIKYGSGICIDSGEMCWELSIPNLIRENSMIISFFSSAAIMPKLIYDMEPVIVFLYPVVKQKFIGADNIVGKLQALYRDPKKIVLIRDLNDYYNYCERYAV